MRSPACAAWEPARFVDRPLEGGLPQVVISTGSRHRHLRGFLPGRARRDDAAARSVTASSIAHAWRGSLQLLQMQWLPYPRDPLEPRMQGSSVIHDLTLPND